MRGGEETPTGGWTDADQVRWYTTRIGKLEARLAGEAALLEALPTSPERVLDLGCGDGRLAGAVLDAFPSVTQLVAFDRSEPMLELARQRFVENRRVKVVNFDLNAALNLDTRFDAVVSGFAIHHLEDQRKRSLFAEIRQLLAPGGVFANLEVVRSSTPRRHTEWRTRLGPR
jgi:tRNA (cmo5U34)-methyltransferase